MRILTITAGAANMYCGSCLRDNALAAELLRQGHEVSLVPIYTPTRTDEINVSESRVHYGGINVYLQQVAPLFRRTPWFIDRIFDAKWLMRIVSRLSMSTDPAPLAGLTISTLKGENGNQRKEVEKLLHWLKGRPRPDLAVLPNSLMIGLAAPLRSVLDCPIACTLQGEDLFLDGLPEAARREAIDLIRQQVPNVSGFISISDYYAGYMTELLRIPPEKIFVVPLGINLDGYEARQPNTGGGPVRVGYFARVAPEKGLHNLAAAYRLMREKMREKTRETTQGKLPPTRLEVAGYLGSEHRGYLAGIESELRSAGLSDEFQYHGVLDRAEKIRFLRTIDVLSVPTDYQEPKGLFLLEAMACGVPVVQPRKGAFPEILERTGGGRLVAANDPAALSDSLAELIQNGPEREALGRRGAEGVRQHFTVQKMAERSLHVYEALITGKPFGSSRKAVELEAATWK